MFKLLAVGCLSRDLSPAEKETTACKADQIHEMATLFIQDNVECQLYITVILFSASFKSRDATANRKNTRRHVDHLILSNISD